MLVSLIITLMIQTNWILIARCCNANWTVSYKMYLATDRLQWYSMYSIRSHSCCHNNLWFLRTGASSGGYNESQKILPSQNTQTCLYMLVPLLFWEWSTTNIISGQQWPCGGLVPVIDEKEMGWLNGQWV